MTVSVANKLVSLRKKNGLSQEELAEQLGISRQAISKWERAEASPDTDNLVLLARLYGISLDALLLDADSAAEDVEQAAKSQSEPEPADSEAEGDQPKNEHVHISWDGIHIKDEDSEVHIDRNGIFVNDKKSDKVEIGDDGIFVNGEHVDPDFDFDDKAERTPEEKQRRKTLKKLENISVFVMLALYLLIGVFLNLWHPGWILILAIPVVTSIFEAIRKRNAHKFVYPVLAIVAYLLMGFCGNLWHPGWVVFLTIPLFYAIVPGKKSHKHDD